MRVLTQPGAVQRHTTVNQALEQELEEQHHLAIQRLAYQLWQEQGSPAGSALNDWLEAEEKLVLRLIPSART